MAFEFRYCPYCGAALVRREVFGSLRPACPACEFVQFLDPKVAVIGLITSAEHVLLIRRGVDPGKGQWALPGGYMDAGEMPQEALHREILEEVGLEVVIDRLLGIYPMATSSRVAGGIVIAYLATPVGDELPLVERNDDVDDAAWFASGELPDEVAFSSSRDLVGQWLDGRV